METKKQNRIRRNKPEETNERAHTKYVSHNSREDEQQHTEQARMPRTRQTRATRKPTAQPAQRHKQYSIPITKRQPQPTPPQLRQQRLRMGKNDAENQE